ncbi:MAG: DEAD/DEAH box helicase [Bacillus sp. (in: Bacteria)]|nr:DEAD/DEAH box helicase [Bacillus sp. (in: firmicutes)]
MKTIHFEDYRLGTEIKQALTEMNYKKPTLVQQEVIPLSLGGSDLIVKSKTGTGKTAAFSIPICELVDWEENKPQALILTPTRELAVQIKEEIAAIGRYKRINAVAIFGKQPFDRQKLALKQKTHVVVGTPGRLLDHIQKGTLNIEKIKHLIIDEADEMLSMGFIDQVEAIIKELPIDRSTSLFSATIPNELRELSQNYMKNPATIEAGNPGANLTADKITHALMKVKESDKLAVLQAVSIAENPDNCIIFCGTQDKVDDVFRHLRKVNFPCEKIHGGLQQKDRLSVMKQFKQGKFRYLIATDLASRGIHIENINLVINLDFPLEKESYVHRTGRTGRAGKAGKAITFVTPYEEKFIDELEKYIGFSIPIIPSPAKELVKERKDAFEQKLKSKPIEKRDPERQQHQQQIMKLYFNGGKKKKLRPVDFVGTITSITGVTGDDIGIIAIEENATYVDILNGKGPKVLKEMKERTIKGKQLKVHEAREER